jgi:hypothetical protein
MVNSQRGLRESCDRNERGETPICQIFSRVSSQNNSQSLAFLAAALGAFMFVASICEGAEPAEGATEPTRPTKEWQTSSPEEQGMDSKEPARMVDFGTIHSLDSLLVVRHGKIVAEAHYAPYAAGIPHTIEYATEAVIGSLTEIASKDGLLDSPSHRVPFFVGRSIANVDERKQAIRFQSRLDMPSGTEWTEPLDGSPDSAIEMERSPNWVKFIPIDLCRLLLQLLGFCRSETDDQDDANARKYVKELT